MAIELTEKGSQIFKAHEAWQEYCRNNKIKDPWVLLQNCENKVNRHWQEFDEKGHLIWHADIYSKDEWPKDVLEEYNNLEKYRDQYMIDREVWTGQYILKNFGYDTLKTFAQTHCRTKTALDSDKAFNKWFAQIRPCDGAEGQCNFSCPIFYSCAVKD